MNSIDYSSQLKIIIPGRGRTAMKRRTVRRRNGIKRNGLKIVGLSALSALILGVAIFLSNGVISAKSDIDRVSKENNFLSTKVGILEKEWNSICSRDIVVTRAKSELGLVNLGGPAAVMVCSQPKEQNDNNVANRIAAIFTGKATTVASARAEVK